MYGVTCEGYFSHQYEQIVLRGVSEFAKNKTGVPYIYTTCSLTKIFHTKRLDTDTYRRHLAEVFLRQWSSGPLSSLRYID